VIDTTQAADDRIRMVRAFGQTIRVSVKPGTGIPLLLCNGIGAGFEVLDPLVDNLAVDRTVIRFDVPGTGGSPNSLLPYGFPYLAVVLGRMLDELSYDRVDILGLSWGGALAQQFAFQNPRRCRRLVLVSTATGALMIPGTPRVLSKMVTPRRFTDPEYLASIAASIYGGSADESSAAVAELFRHQLASGSKRGYLYQLLAGSVWTSLFALPLIRQPTLIIAGTDDPIIPVVNARIMRRLLPNATLELHDGGHIDLVTRPGTFAPTIDNFLHDPVSTRTSDGQQ
jgi:poly(3-hydroxyalkanoate) depolymerase